jgi:hypothetical protein
MVQSPDDDSNRRDGGSFLIAANIIGRDRAATNAQVAATPAAAWIRRPFVVMSRLPAQKRDKRTSFRGSRGGLFHLASGEAADRCQRDNPREKATTSCLFAFA